MRMSKKIQSHKKGMVMMDYNAHSQPAGILRSRAKHGINSEVSVIGAGVKRHLRSLHVNAGFRGVEAYRITLYHFTV